MQTKMQNMQHLTTSATQNISVSVKEIRVYLIKDLISDGQLSKPSKQRL